MTEQNERENIIMQGAEAQASASKRRPRLNETSVNRGPVEAAKAESEAERSSAWPAQYEGDGWDQVPVQMRP